MYVYVTLIKIYINIHVYFNIFFIFIFTVFHLLNMFSVLLLY